MSNTAMWPTAFRVAFENAGVPPKTRQGFKRINLKCQVFCDGKLSVPRKKRSVSKT